MTLAWTKRGGSVEMKTIMLISLGVKKDSNRNTTVLNRDVKFSKTKPEPITAPHEI